MDKLSVPLLKNREVFSQDPLATHLPNDGVTVVAEPRTPEEWDVLRYELSSFVCQGEYRDGIERVLDTYLKNLGEAKQPAVWVSGFYGSGKSHLVRVLEFLWRDMPLPGGATARGLVKLTPEIAEHFRELSTAARREGGLWSAAGTLGAGAGDNVRLSLLSIVFRSAGLPDRYPAARFVLWLRQNGYYEAVRAKVEAAGKVFEKEALQLYASPLIAKGLLDVFPSFADTEAQARVFFKEQFPNVTDISDDEMVDTLSDVLALKSSTPGKLPCTLIVLDELQQFMDDRADRIYRVQEVVQACSTRFGSRLLFVATGQSAVTATAQLQKLQGRFTVRVELADTDVETVVRSVVLRKAPQHEMELQGILDMCSGEIDRQLAGTKLAVTGADKTVLLADYPLLPVRRRFWERVLRAVDRAGQAGQLRTQLKVVHEAARAVAEESIGTVVGADFLYGQIAPTLRQTGVLLRDIEEVISRLDDGTDNGNLRSRLCALIFLISQLPTGSGGGDTGVRATADTLADLLVTDLRAGGTKLRARVPDALQALVDAGHVVSVGLEYRLQTRESAEWDGEFRARFTKVFSDDARVAGDRTTELRAAVTRTLQGITATQGVSKTPRKVELHFTPDAPKTDTGGIPVWVRDEWSVSDKTVREDAQAAGADGPIVYVFLPRRGGEDLRSALASLAAADETLNAKGVPATREGDEARAGMLSRKGDQRRQVDTLITGILKDARVFQGGGNEVALGDLRAAVDTAAVGALARLYPQFGVGDGAKWDTVFERARQGNGDALAAVGYTGDVVQHPVCRQVLEFISTADKKGAEVRSRFSGPPFGWPKDAADAALLVLLQAGSLRAALNGTPVALSTLDRTKIGVAVFRAESATLTTPQRIALRKLLTDAGVPFKTGEEPLALPQLIRNLIDLAQDAGGAAPLPPPPDTSHLEALQYMAVGNELAVKVHDIKDQIAQEALTWKARANTAKERLPEWERAARLLKHAEDLPVYAQAAPVLEAVKTNRSLLNDPDAIAPVCASLTDALRLAAKEARQRHMDAYAKQIEGLVDSAPWAMLDDKVQGEIRKKHTLGIVPEIVLGTETQVLSTLDNISIADWDDRTVALSERIARALFDATKMTQPKAKRVSVPPATLTNEDEADEYLARLRTEIMTHLSAGDAVVI